MLVSRIHSEPPRKPVYSYHCTRRGLVAKDSPRISQGQDISTFWYTLSHAIHAAMKKMYGRAPEKRLRNLRNSQKMKNICRAFSAIAATAPAGDIHQIQKVVAMLNSKKGM